MWLFACIILLFLATLIWINNETKIEEKEDDEEKSIEKLDISRRSFGNYRTRIKVSPKIVNLPLSIQRPMHRSENPFIPREASYYNVPNNLDELLEVGNGFSMVIAKWMHFFCRLSYCKPVTRIFEMGCIHCQHPTFRNVEMDSVFIDSDLQITGYLCSIRLSGKVVFLMCFRGTNSYGNWIVNLNVFKTPWNQESLNLDSESINSETETVPGEVHLGFFQGYNRINSKCRQGIRRLQKRYGKDCRLILTGHSLGGALATLAAADLLQQKYITPDILTLYTFGSPRVGDKTFAKWMKMQQFETYRITTGSDLVPQMPPSTSFRHIEQEVYFPNPSVLSYRMCRVTPLNKSPKEDPNGVLSAKRVSTSVSINMHEAYLGAELPGCDGASMPDEWFTQSTLLQ